MLYVHHYGYRERAQVSLRVPKCLEPALLLLVKFKLEPHELCTYTNNGRFCIINLQCIQMSRFTPMGSSFMLGQTLRLAVLKIES